VAAANTKRSTPIKATQTPGRRLDFHSTGESDEPDDENTTPARVRSVPHDGQCSADEYTGDPHIGQG
jgi:hypothetical protein